MTLFVLLLAIALGFRLEDCATQRNLTDEGRAHARRVGEAFRARAIPVERVLSSPWCRCLETRGNLVLVTHGSTIQAVTGINPGTAEMVIVTPQGAERFAVAGRLVVP